MFGHVNRHRFGSGYIGLVRLSFVFLKGFFAGQLKAAAQTPAANETRLCDTKRRKGMKEVRQQV